MADSAVRKQFKQANRQTKVNKLKKKRHEILDEKKQTKMR